MEDLKSSPTGLSAAGMWIQTDGGCKLECQKHFNKSNVWAAHKEDKKGKTEAGRWRADRSRAEPDGEKRPGTGFPSTLSSLSSLLPIAPPGLPLSHLSASPSTSTSHLFPVCFSAWPLHFLPEHPVGVALVNGAASRHHLFYFWSRMKEDRHSIRANDLRMLKHPLSGPAKPNVCVQSFVVTY